MARKPKRTSKGKARAKSKAPAESVKSATKPKTAAKARAKTPSKAKSKPAAPQKPKRQAAKTAKKKEPALHWLVRPDTIRRLWIGGGVVLAALVAAEVGVHAHGYFGLDGTFAFNAWYGFAACVAMVVAAKGLGAFLKREDTYYDGD